MEARGTSGISMKSLERVVSDKALKLGNSFPCQICVVGFLCGICLTSLFLAALTSIGTFELAAFSFSSFSPPCNSTSQIISMFPEVLVTTCVCVCGVCFMFYVMIDCCVICRHRQETEMEEQS